MAKQDLVFTPTAENLPSALAKVQANTEELYTAVTGAAIKTAYEAETGAYNGTKDTKLAGIATGATANAADASLLSRANHTGTQALSTISDAGTLAGLNSVDLTANVTGVLPPANLGTGTASGTTFLAGDGAYKVPAGGTQSAKNSIEIDAGDAQLVGDAASPGNNQLYGTSGAGVKGWYAIPTGGAEVNDLTANVTWANVPDANITEGSVTQHQAAVVTTTAVTTAGALMDSEVTNLTGVKTLTVPDSTTISAFGATLLDDADAAAARATLGTIEDTTELQDILNDVPALRSESDQIRVDLDTLAVIVGLTIEDKRGSTYTITNADYGKLLLVDANVTLPLDVDGDDLSRLTLWSFGALTIAGETGAVTITGDTTMADNEIASIIIESTTGATASTWRTVVTGAAAAGGSIDAASDTSITAAAKGDLLVFDGTSWVDGPTVGANDTVLTADSTTATGLKYATVAGGGGGDVLKVGSPVDDQIAVWTGDGTIEGQSVAAVKATINTLTLNTQTGTAYTTVLSDAQSVKVSMNNAAANTVTIAANASVAYPVGTQIHFEQLGAGATTVAIASDTLNVNAALTAVLNGQYAVATAIKNTATTWTLCGNLVAS